MLCRTVALGERMSDDAAAERVRTQVDTLYRAESRHVLATLIRLLKDFDLAEEALHEAFTAAVQQWPQSGIPANPRAWLVSTGRFKAIDVMRRRVRFNASLTEVAEHLYQTTSDPTEYDDEHLEDDRLRLIYTCCHPALSPEAQVAMTLREVCGLTTEEIARAFLISPPTVAQRIVRAKGKIREARIPYQVPSPSELPERLDAVLRVVYLAFNEGYSASSGTSLTRADLSGEAIRLGRLLLELMQEPEVMGLLGLMLLHESRRTASHIGDGRTRAPGSTGPFTLEPRSHSGRHRTGGAVAVLAAIRSLYDSSCHRGSACRITQRLLDRLGSDRRTLRSADPGGPFPRGRVKSRRRGGDA